MQNPLRPIEREYVHTYLVILRPRPIIHAALLFLLAEDEDGSFSDIERQCLKAVFLFDPLRPEDGLTVPEAGPCAGRQIEFDLSTAIEDWGD